MILGIIQARTSSSRLPGKVLLPLAGKPMLWQQVERLLRAERLDRLIIATTEEREDDAIVALAEEFSIALYRGSRDDVLDRFYRAARALRPDFVVRLTADCPLCDWQLIDQLVEFAVDGDYDYASNCLEPSWPDGLDAEVVRFAALECAWSEAASRVDREHVTQFIIRQPERFRVGSMRHGVDLSQMRWTVDEPQDYEFVARVYDELYAQNRAFSTGDVLQLLRRKPELLAINSGIGRNEGLLRSIEQELEEHPHD
jgi:spore coat polysaccharide biosynthesis protein SpsF